MKRTRRTSIELMVEILKACCNSNAKKTKIVNLTNLNSKLTNEYLKFLSDKDFIIYKGNTYQISESGKNFLNKINEIQTLLKIDKP